MAIGKRGYYRPGPPPQKGGDDIVAEVAEWRWGKLGRQGSISYDGIMIHESENGDWVEQVTIDGVSVTDRKCDHWLIGVVAEMDIELASDEEIRAAGGKA